MESDRLIHRFKHFPTPHVNAIRTSREFAYLTSPVPAKTPIKHASAYTDRAQKIFQSACAPTSLLDSLPLSRLVDFLFPPTL